jgi:hypothetical protein
MTIDDFSNIANIIIKAAAVTTAVGVLCGVVFGFWKWIINMQNKNKLHDEQISQMKEENALIVYALSACLDGLQQLGANHSVPVAKDKLDKYINQQAHK